VNLYDSGPKRFAKRMIWNAQGGICHLCGDQLSTKWSSQNLTFEHVWPKSKVAGRNDFEGNVMLAHKACNQAKNDRPPHPCELIYLSAVNRRLGYKESETAIWEKSAWQSN